MTGLPANCYTRLYFFLPGAVTDGVTLFIFKNRRPFISYRPQKLMTFLVIVTTPTLSPTSSHRFSSTLCKIQPHFFTFIRVSLPGWCHPGRSAPTFPLPLPSNATVLYAKIMSVIHLMTSETASSPWPLHSLCSWW